MHTNWCADVPATRQPLYGEEDDLISGNDTLALGLCVAGHQTTNICLPVSMQRNHFLKGRKINSVSQFQPVCSDSHWSRYTIKKYHIIWTANQSGIKDSSGSVTCSTTAGGWQQADNCTSLFGWSEDRLCHCVHVWDIKILAPCCMYWAYVGGRIQWHC